LEEATLAHQNEVLGFKNDLQDLPWASERLTDFQQGFASALPKSGYRH